MLKADKPVFYEFLTLGENDGSLIIRLKHFSADFVDWEEKDKTVDFRFVKKAGNCIYFGEMTFEPVSSNELNVYLVIGNKDGSIKEEIFRYRRIV